MKNTDTSLEIKKEVEPIVKLARSLIINDEETMLKSVEILSQCNLNLDRAKKEMETIINPAKEIIKREQSRWEPIIDPLKESVLEIRKKQSEYQTMLVRKTKEEEDKIISRVGEGKGKLKTETAIKKLGEIEKPQDKVVSQTGSVAFRDHQVLKITSLTDIPFEYFELNQSKLTQALKAGIEVPGAELETIQIPINRR